jgi:hypothetical protein
LDGGLVEIPILPGETAEGEFLPPEIPDVETNLQNASSMAGVTVVYREYVFVSDGIRYRIRGHKELLADNIRGWSSPR